MWKIIQSKIKYPKKAPSMLPMIQKGSSTSLGFNNQNQKEYSSVNQNSKLDSVINKTQNDLKFIQDNDIKSVTQKNPLLLENLKDNFQLTGLASFKPAYLINDPINKSNLYNLYAYIIYFWFSGEHFMDPLYIKTKKCISIPSNLFTPHPTDDKFFKHFLSLKQHFICLINNNKNFDIKELMEIFLDVDFSSFNEKATINLWIECYIAEKTLHISKISQKKHVEFINHENSIYFENDDITSEAKYSNTNIFKPSESLAQIKQPFSDLHIYSHVINVAGECYTTSTYKDVKALYTGPNKGHITINTDIIKNKNALKAYIYQYKDALQKEILKPNMLHDKTDAKILLDNINLEILPLLEKENQDLSKILEQFNNFIDADLFKSSLSSLGLNFSKVVASLDPLNQEDIHNLHEISSNIENLLKEKRLEDTDFFLNKTVVHPYNVTYENFKFFKILPIKLQIQAIENFQKFLTL